MVNGPMLDRTARCLPSNFEQDTRCDGNWQEINLQSGVDRSNVPRWFTFFVMVVFWLGIVDCACSGHSVCIDVHRGSGS